MIPQIVVTASNAFLKKIKMRSLTGQLCVQKRRSTKLGHRKGPKIGDCPSVCVCVPWVAECGGAGEVGIEMWHGKGVCEWEVSLLCT